MSDLDRDNAAAGEPTPSVIGSATAAEPETLGPPAPTTPPPRMADVAAANANRRVLAVLAVTLVAILVLAGTAPFWAPALPWGAAHDDSALAEWLDRLEAAQQRTEGLAPRLDRIETAQRDLAQKTQQALQNQGSVATQLQPLDQRLTALENKPTVPPATLDDLRRQLSQQGSAVTALTARVDTLDKAVHAQVANAAADTTALLALAQIRDAVDTGRPFADAYQVLAGVSAGQPELAQAVAPLAAPAKTGVATRAVLIERLRAEKDKIAAAPPADTGGSWGDAAVARLRGLVTIRRIDKPTSPEAANTPAGAVDAADKALSAGDLQGAITAIGHLSGRAAEQAAPWLHMAQQRLAVETALHRLDTMLTAKLGKASPPAAGSGG